jgi:preprotein translocase subunit SecG
MVTAVFVALVVVAVALMGAVLLQSGRTAGMGAMAGQSTTMYGKKKGLDELLERATLVLGALLVILTTLGARLWR